MTSWLGALNRGLCNRKGAEPFVFAPISPGRRPAKSSARSRIATLIAIMSDGLLRVSEAGQLAGGMFGLLFAGGDQPLVSCLTIGLLIDFPRRCLARGYSLDFTNPGTPDDGLSCRVRRAWLPQQNI